VAGFIVKQCYELLKNVNRQENELAELYLGDVQDRRTYRWLPGAIVIAVLGLLVIQIILIDGAYRAADKAFAQNVNAALQTVAQRLETREIVTTVLWVGAGRGPFSPSDPGEWRSRVMMAAPHGKIQDSCAGPIVGIVGMSGTHPDSSVRELREVHVTGVGRAAGKESVRVSSSRVTGLHQTAVGTSGTDSTRFSFRFETTNDSLLMNVTGGDTANIVTSSGARTRSALITRVIDRLSGAERKPIQQRVSASQLDSLLRANLRENGITLDFTFGVAVPGEDSLRVAGPGAMNFAVLRSPYRTRLFPADILAPPNDLLVMFPREQWYLFGKVGPYAFATLLFAALIIFGSAHAFRTIARQERLSTQVRDFINNMVHEFKTPLSTITLAAEAMVRPDVIGQRVRIRRYSGVIEEETARMKDQVSKILQMAMVEEGDYELRLVPLDMLALLEQVASVFAVQVESRGDAMHLTNVVHNILENALKYTPGPPDIQIRAGIRGDRIEVRFADNGIGMTASEAEKAFDKYYRVPTGNLHDVKGFGLGLAYVRLMVHAMKGTVAIESTPGKGTTVILGLPRQEGV
jgi:signal transduction histidine kinase